MLKKIKSFFKNPKTELARLSSKDQATLKGEPWVSIVDLKIDPETMAAGSVELDWNEIFITRLMKRGYLGRTDADIVDQWFQEVCRGVAMELWEQQEAQDGPARRQRD